MRFLVFQHIAVEHPGVFRDFMAADGVAWDAVELDEGAPVPRLDGYDALLVMGGPMDVWEEAAHPWLVPEKAAIREAVTERDLPVLGICLGHPLLADALGGRVRPMPAPEVGVCNVELTADGGGDPVLTGFPQRVGCLQWHGSEVAEAPPGAAVLVLASSPACRVQALRVGERAYGFQYHVEITETTVADWGCVPAYAESLENALGAGALARFEAETAASLETFRTDARRLYDNFKKLL